MRVSRVARRYAGALFNAARTQGLIDPVQQDLAVAASFLHENPSVLEALSAPRIPAERKKAALNSLIGSRLTQPLSRKFIDLMVDHGREGSLPEAAYGFSVLADEAKNILAVNVRTAAPLDADQTTRLKAKLDQITGKDTRVETVVDASLVGGLIVRIGDRILDGSVRGYLEQFGRQLREAPLGTISLDSVPTA